MERKVFVSAEKSFVIADGGEETLHCRFLQMLLKQAGKICRQSKSDRCRKPNDEVCIKPNRCWCRHRAKRKTERCAPHQPPLRRRASESANDTPRKCNRKVSLSRREKPRFVAEFREFVSCWCFVRRFLSTNFRARWFADFRLSRGGKVRLCREIKFRWLFAAKLHALVNCAEARINLRPNLRKL